MFRRRRPLMRAAVVGGGAYVAGKGAARRSAEREQQENEQNGRAFRTEFRDQFRLWRHLLIPAAAALVLLFPLWGIIRPPAYTLVNLLPFTGLGWLCLGAIAAAVLRARRHAAFAGLDREFTPTNDDP